MKLLILLLLISCQAAHKPMELNAEDLQQIKDISNKNGGLKELSMRFGEAYKLEFKNDSFFIKGSDYCHYKSLDCIKVTEEEITWCQNLCQTNDGLQKISLNSSCENFRYMGESVAGYCEYYKYTWKCQCKNQVSQIKEKKVEGKK